MAELLKLIRENVPGVLGTGILAVVIVFGILGWLSNHKDIFKPVSNKVTAAKTRKTEIECLSDRPVRVRENFRFRDKLVKKWSRKIWKARKSKRNKFLIHGFGGVGKTAVAAALYDKLENKCEQIGWVECRESGDLRASLRESFKTGNEKKTDEERWAEIKRQLDATGETILFLDNVDRPDELLTELRRYKLTVIVTSRMEHVEDYTSIPIPPLSEDECVELFRTYCSEPIPEQDKPVVRDLVRLVSCHTLSVELLAKGIPWGTKLAEYRDGLQAEGFGFPNLEFSTGRDQEEKTVVGHLKRLFNMANLDKEQIRVMQNLALMADSRALPFAVREWIDCDENTLARLVRTGWLTRTEGGYEVHPIVRAVVLLDEVPVEAVEKFLNFVAKKKFFQDGEDYRAVQFKLGIVEAVLEKVEDRLEESESTAALYTRLGNVYDGQGNYTQAEKFHQKALDIRLNVLGEDDLTTAKSYNSLGVVYHDQGKYTKAEEKYKQALDIYLKYGENQLATADSYNNLGTAYHDQRNYAKAEEKYQQALDIYLKYGENHLDTADIYNNLGCLYDDQENYAKAEEKYQQALDIYLNEYDKDHPATANSYNNLGVAYHHQGNYDKAKEKYQQALEIYRKVLGEDHPATARCYNNLGVIYEHQKKYDDAAEQLLNAWKIHQYKLGPEHPDTKRAIRNLRRIFPHTKYSNQDFETWLSSQ